MSNLPCEKRWWPYLARNAGTIIVDEEYYPPQHTRIACSKVDLPDIHGGVNNSKSYGLTHIVHL